MRPSVTQRPRARLDLLEQFVYFGEQANVDVAERYFEAFDKTCALLVQQPQAGKPFETGINRLARLRHFPVKGFENHLIFYIPRRNGIEVVRVIHGARDIESVLNGES
jgi:toxin ParE1/3/4